MSRMVRLVVVALAAALVLSATPAFGYVKFTGASFADSNNGYLSGRLSQTMGFVSTTRDGGATWSLKAFPSLQIGSVAAWGASGAIAGPLAGGFVYSFPATGAWNPTKPMPDFFDTIGGVGAVGSGAIVAVGRSTAGAVIAVSNDGGGSWSANRVSAEQVDAEGDPITQSTLRSVDFAGGTGWAAGDRLSTDNKLHRGVLVFKSSDSGASWVQQTAPAGTTDRTLQSLTAGSADVAFVGRKDGSVIKTIDGGQIWTVAAPAFAPGTSVNAIDSRGASRLVAVGPFGNVAWSTDGAASWTRKQMLNGKHLSAVSMLSDSTWIVAGDGFSAYRTTDAGRNWSSLSPQKTVAKPTVSAPYAAAPVYRAKTRSWYGYISPRHDPRVASVKLTFQRYSSGAYGAYSTKYASVSDYKSENKSRYASSVSLKSTGKYRVKATYVSEWGGTITSSWRTFTVK